MIHVEDYDSCSVNKGNEMHGRKAEQSIAPTQRCSLSGPACKTAPVRPWDEQNPEHYLAVLAHMVAARMEQELDIQRSE